MLVKNPASTATAVVNLTSLRIYAVLVGSYTRAHVWSFETAFNTKFASVTVYVVRKLGPLVRSNLLTENFPAGAEYAWNHENS